jgi:hypothetical protein
MKSVKVERPHLSVRPSYIGHSTGARVAPQRCPILRKDKHKLYINAFATPQNFEISNSYPTNGQRLNDSAPHIVKENFEIKC